MRRHSKTTLLGWATVSAAAALLTAACSSAAEDSAQTAEPPPAATAELPPLPAEPVPPGGIGISSAGVTTSVAVPAEATESQYGQACLAAKEWLDERREDPKALVESYLKVVQDPAFVGPATFDTPWAQLTPAQQAGAIMAANGAAEGQCS